MPTTLRFSNQGPIVLGLGGAYPNYASIPTVFGGPSQGILISVYNRGGAYVPNTALNTLIPTTIGAGNSVDWSDYYTSSNYSSGSIPPVPNPRPGPDDQPIYFGVNAANPYRAYIGDTYSLGNIVAKGNEAPVYCTAVTINGFTTPNVAVNQSQIQFVVAAEMNYDITTPADVSFVISYKGVTLANYNIPKYFTRFPIDVSVAVLSVPSAMAGESVAITDILSLQSTPNPTVTIGGVTQTVVTTTMISVSFTVNPLTPTVDSDIVITNNAGDSATLPVKFKRVTNVNPNPESPEIDRGPPPNIEWDAEDSQTETLTFTVSSDFLARPTFTGNWPYPTEQVGSFQNVDNVLSSPNAVTFSNAGGLANSSGQIYGIPLPGGGDIGQFVTRPPSAGSYTYYDTTNWLVGGISSNDTYFVRQAFYTGAIIRINPSAINNWVFLGTVTNGGSQPSWTGSRPAPGIVQEVSNSQGGWGSNGQGRTVATTIQGSGTSWNVIGATPINWSVGDSVYARTDYVIAKSDSSGASCVDSGGGLRWYPAQYNQYIFYNTNSWSSGFIVNPYGETVTALDTTQPGISQTTVASISGSGYGCGPATAMTGAALAAYQGQIRVDDEGDIGYVSFRGIFYVDPGPSSTWNQFASIIRPNADFTPTGTPQSIYFVGNPGGPGGVFWAGLRNQNHQQFSDNFVQVLSNYSNNVLLDFRFAVFENVALTNTVVNGLVYLGNREYYCYFTATRSGVSGQYRVRFSLSADGTTSSGPSPTSYSLTRPANAKYNWSALNLSYLPVNTQTPQQVATALSTLISTNWGGNVAPTITVASDNQNNWVVTVNTNILAQSETQFNLTGPSQTGSITFSSSGGFIPSDVTRLAISTTGPIYIDSSYGYVNNLTFSHDGAGFDANSAVIPNPNQPSNISTQYNF